MSVLIYAAAFFALLMLVTVVRALRPRPVRVEVSPMKATLERRIRNGDDFQI